ncbi:MAG: hypothetical protein EOO24_50810 [Comamonadaceae bacterium]|nr:MAG: hypothetical protein EOO24_50810 [Comamonadaceae bacterium]
MAWLQKIFGTTQRDGASGGGPLTSQFRESDGGNTEDEAASRNAARRELLQVVLRDTMRQHGIPSDWIECRFLSTVSRAGRPGLHVNFVVKQAHDRLLHYVFAFQASYERELARFEPRSRDWLLGMSWEFRDFKGSEAMPDPSSWAGASAKRPAAPGIDGEGDVRKRAFAPTSDPYGEEPGKSEDDVQRDLAALFAIRDAALADAARKPASPHADFELTRPFEDSGGGAKR